MKHAHLIADAVARRARRPIVTRFAPSPTGYLHLGHVVNAIFVWGLARATGGHVRVRIEDHDRTRCRPEYEAACLDDLDWLGFEADAGRRPPDRQSDRRPRYDEVVARLAATGLVYGCACSRREIGGERYDGRCLSLGLSHAPPHGLRVRIGPDTESFDDVCLGAQQQCPAHQCGDVLVRDRLGHYTYQFAVTVDDLDQEVTLIVRGADLLDSTGRQLALAHLLGRTDPPLFVHHPLILDASGRKLSKSAGDTSVRELRAAGATADEVLGRAAAAVGLVPEGTRLPASQVADIFRPGRAIISGPDRESNAIPAFGIESESA